MREKIIAALAELIDALVERLSSQLDPAVPFKKEAYLNVKEAAAFLGVTERSVHRYKSLRLLDSKKFGGIIYFTQSSLEDFKAHDYLKLE